MPDFGFPSNSKKNKDISVPLGDILSRSGKYHKDYHVAKNVKAAQNTLKWLGILLVVVLVLWLLTNILTAHAYSKGLGERVYTEMKFEALRDTCESIVQNHD